MERLDYVDCLLFSCKLPDEPDPLDDWTALTRGDYVCSYTTPTGTSELLPRILERHAADKVTPRVSDLERKKWRTRVGKLALQHIRIANPGLKIDLPEHLIKGGSLEDEDTDESTEDEDEDIGATEDESD